MSNNQSEIKVDLTFICPKCGTTVEHNYTQDDVLNKEELEFNCECGYSEKVKTSTLIDKAMNATKKELEKELGKYFKMK